ncbi:MAG: aminotransferase class I/II-fold pyridoxal phosphate-dependent enzyme [Acidobacteriota bacterium]|jgi:aspartate/methionine/tyrosine aminotransferase
MPDQGAERRVSLKAGRFTESVIREMTRLANRHGAINLAQGFPNFPAPHFIKVAAHRAIDAEFNQYAITWGSPRLREAIAEKYARHYGWEVDPEREITVCCGATESMISSILALIDPAEQVAVFEPFYENYGPDTVIAGAVPVFVPLDAQRAWAFDYASIETRIREAASRSGLRALILNTPNNPTGRVFSDQELESIAELARRHGFYVITDEIYEHITYDGHRHRPIALLPGMRDRTVTISGLSKTFSVTGWRLGYVIAPADLTGAIRKVHDFLTVGAPAPLQEAAAAALRIGADYYQNLAENYRRRRDLLLAILEDAGFKTWTPHGAYYIMADISQLTDETDVEFVKRLIREQGVAAVPGSSFFSRPELGRQLVRFTFCKTEALLEEVGRRLRKGLSR